MTPERCVSAVVVTYQSSACIGTCLDSLMTTAGDWLADCIVVDNASTDGTTAEIRARNADVSLIENAENIGFGRAINIGARAARGSLLLILNPDTVVQQGMVAELALFMRSREEACACGPKIVGEDGVFHAYSRRGFPTPWNALCYLTGLDRFLPRSRKFGSYHHRNYSKDYEMMVECLSGSCMMVRKDGFDAIGGFDEDYFLFGEDIDLCWRLSRSGKELWYIPSAVLMHRKGISMRQAPRTAHHEFYRAMRLFFDKRLAEAHSRLMIFAVRSGITTAEWTKRIFSGGKYGHREAGHAHSEREIGWPNKLQKPEP